MARESGVSAAGVELGGAWLNIVLGILVVATPFVIDEGGILLWNDVIVGLLVVGLAFVTSRAATHDSPKTAIMSGVLNLVLGVWLIVFPFVATAGGPYLWVNLTLGLFIAFNGGWDAYTANAAGEGGWRRTSV